MVRNAISSGTSPSASPWTSRTGQSDRDLAAEQIAAAGPTTGKRAVMLAGAALQPPVGEVGRAGDPDQRLDPVGAAQGKVERDPPAHRRADQDQRAFGQPVDGGEAFLEPFLERSVLEIPGARSGARIIEAQHRDPAPLGESVERQRLGPFHVRCIAGEKDQSRSLRRREADRQCGGRRVDRERQFPACRAGSTLDSGGQKAGDAPARPGEESMIRSAIAAMIAAALAAAPGYAQTQGQPQTPSPNYPYQEVERPPAGEVIRDVVQDALDAAAPGPERRGGESMSGASANGSSGSASKRRSRRPIIRSRRSLSPRRCPSRAPRPTPSSIPSLCRHGASRRRQGPLRKNRPPRSR